MNGLLGVSYSEKEAADDLFWVMLLGNAEFSDDSP